MTHEKCPTGDDDDGKYLLRLFFRFLSAHEIQNENRKNHLDLFFKNKVSARVPDWKKRWRLLKADVGLIETEEMANENSVFPPFTLSFKKARKTETLEIQ